MKNDANLTTHFSGISRREMLKALGTAGAGAMICTSYLPGQTSRGQGNPRRIDVHHHPTMPGERGAGPARWTTAIALEMMDKFGIETTIVSQPGSGGDAADGTEKGRAAARRVNEFHAKLVSDYPKRFGLFATIPYPDVEGSMRELEYAFGTLKADGVLLTSSVGSRWPGDPFFNPVWE